MPCRPQRKLLHAALHTLAVIAVALALVAAFQSHTLKRPVPTPNLYSPHSYLGITTLVLLSAQVKGCNVDEQKIANILRRDLPT